MFGGEYPVGYEDRTVLPVAAVIEFQCDPDRSGLEGLASSEQHISLSGSSKVDASEGFSNQTWKSLQFKSFGLVDEGRSYLLNLDWKTRYACDNYLKHRKEGGGGGARSGWRFVTWFIILYVFQHVCSV